MPYFVYKIHPPRKLELVEAFDAYREAKTLARSMRAALTPEDDYTVRLIFAPNPPEAERLLSEVREERPLGEDA